MGWSDYSSGSCAYERSGRRLWTVCPGTGPDDPRITVFDTERWEPVAEQRLPVGEECHFEFQFHPDGEVVYVEAGAGQNGIWTYRCRLLESGRLEVEHLEDLDWRPIFVIHPSGHELLTGSLMDCCLQRRRLPERDILAEVEGEHCFVLCAPIFLSGERILLVTGEGDLWTVDAVSLGDPRPIAGSPSDFVDIRRLGEERLVSIHERPEICIWRCPG